jgi:hypothetical protein
MTPRNLTLSTETPYDDLILFSLVTHRHLRVEPGSDVISADHPGPQPDRKNGSCFRWKEIGAARDAAFLAANSMLSEVSASCQDMLMIKIQTSRRNFTTNHLTQT